MSDFPVQAARRIARLALREDLGAGGDATSRALIPPGRKARGVIVVRQSAVIAGLPAAEAVFRALSRSTVVRHLRSDGEEAAAHDEVAVIFGPARALLAAERTALNLVARLSGIATLTRRFVERAAPVRVFDTRKTTPGLRALEKYAVRVGGGHNHRSTLETFFAKDNHIAAAGLPAVLAAAPPGSTVEATSPEEAEAIAACPNVARILLDNMPPPILRQAIRRARAVRPDVILEASGGIGLENVAEIAACGVDAISVGALTHSAPAADVSMTLTPIR